MLVPIGICTPDPSDQGTGWLILALVVFVYFGILYVSMRRARQGGWLRVGATWLFSAAAVTMFVLWSEEAGLSDEATILVSIAVVTAAALVGIALRGSEGAWRYLAASALGGVTPIALLIAAIATLYATGGCLD